MKAKTLTYEVNTNSITTKIINYSAAIALLASAATASAGDNELWREQASSIPGQSISSFTVGKPGGSSFLDAVRDNHLSTSQDDASIVKQQGQYLSDTDTVNGNWFFNTISPCTYSYSG